jgi:hypothetical protein
MWIWLAPAFAAPAVHVTVTDPSGAVLHDREGPLPFRDLVTAGRTGLSVYVSPFDVRRGVMELAAGRSKKRGVVKMRVADSVEMDPFVPIEREIAWKGQTFRVRAVFGEAVAAPEPVAPPTTARFVRVWDDAALLASPRDPASAVRERDLPDGRADAAEQASPMKVVASWGETHLEMETVPSPGPEHCYGVGGPPAEAWPLQFYVGRSDSVVVVVRTLSASFPDGTGYVVSPGTAALEGDSPGRAVVASDGLWLEIDVTEGDLGSLYTLGDLRPRGDAGVSVAPDTVLDTTFGPVRWLGIVPLPISGIEGLEHPIATLRSGCLEVRVPFSPGPGTAPSTSP